MELEKTERKTAGIDIGSTHFYVGGVGPDPVVFETYHEDCVRLSAFLKANGVESVAMESTGVYWVQLYDVLTREGIEVCLANPKHTKQLRHTRKSDMKDCQWIAMLHSYGLLRNSFVPTGITREVRNYLRLRDDLVRDRARQENLMAKALIQMNIRITEVLSGLSSVSGLAVIRAITAGERDPEKLLSLCHGSVVKKKGDAMLKALAGDFRDDHLFALEGALASWDYYGGRIKLCDAKLEDCLDRMGGGVPPPEAASPPKPSRTVNMPVIEDLHNHLLHVCGGRDATLIPGITDYSLMKLVGEVGTDMSHWPSSKHFASWLVEVSPNHESTRCTSKTRRGVHAGTRRPSARNNHGRPRTAAPWSKPAQ